MVLYQYERGRVMMIVFVMGLIPAVGLAVRWPKRIDCCPDRVHVRCPLFRIGCCFPSKIKGQAASSCSVCCSICARCIAQFVHRKRKCLIVSFACPQAHWSDSAAPIQCRYPLSFVAPVRSCANTPASLRLRISYKMRVCLPGSAVSISLEYLPTPSGSAFSPRNSALAMFIVVDLVR